VGRKLVLQAIVRNDALTVLLKPIALTSASCCERGIKLNQLLITKPSASASETGCGRGVKLAPRRLALDREHGIGSVLEVVVRVAGEV
jgi:hypothetical protein